MNKKIYDFSNQNNLGKQGEEILDRWLGNIYQIEDVSNVKKYRKIGIDRILTCSDGRSIDVEYKFDLASLRTGNLFFETVSVDTQNKPGWGWSSQADYWIFLLPTQEVIIVEPSQFRVLVWQLRSNLRERIIPNQGYNTRGLPVPLQKVKEIAYYQTQLKI